METTITKTIIDGKQVWVWTIKDRAKVWASGMGRTKRDAQHDADWLLAGRRTR